MRQTSERIGPVLIGPRIVLIARWKDWLLRPDSNRGATFGTYLSKITLAGVLRLSERLIPAFFPPHPPISTAFRIPASLWAFSRNCVDIAI